MIVEPNCDMPWEVYLDWLADQGYDDLRFVDIFTVGDHEYYVGYHLIEENDNLWEYFACGDGDGNASWWTNPLDFYRSGEGKSVSWGYVIYDGCGGIVFE